MENNKKIGLTPLNWILSIIGIIFFSLFIVLPPIFRAFIVPEDEIPNNENEVMEPGETTPIVNKTYICSKNGLISEEYRIILEDDNIKIISYTNESIYIEGDINTTCEQVTNTFIDSEGLYNNCETTNDKRIINYRIDLDTYKEETSPLEFDYRLSRQELIDYLALDGFSCNESEQ